MGLIMFRVPPLSNSPSRLRSHVTQNASLTTVLLTTLILAYRLALLEFVAALMALCGPLATLRSFSQDMEHTRNPQTRSSGRRYSLLVRSTVMYIADILLPL